MSIGLARLTIRLKRRRARPHLVGSSIWEELFARLEESQTKYSDLGEEFTRMQERLGKATGLLDDGREEYLSLYSSRLSVLKQVGELVIKYERRGYPQLAQDLEEVLLMEKLERFEPVVGEPVPSGGRCVVDGKLESTMFPPGSVAIVSAPGFCTSDGEVVVLPAHVYQCVSQVAPAGDKITVGEFQNANCHESRALSHYLLLKACALYSKGSPTKH